tara:strand:+ start:770 stop:1051 length:282 start_codon:yes stop_codon:yes gene_type:complete
MKQKLMEIRMAVSIWDAVYETISELPEFIDMSEREQEKMIGECTRGVAEILVEDLMERCAEMKDSLQKENYWGNYTIEPEERKWSYEEASRGY